MFRAEILLGGKSSTHEKSDEKGMRSNKLVGLFWLSHKEFRIDENYSKHLSVGFPYNIPSSVKLYGKQSEWEMKDQNCQSGWIFKKKKVGGGEELIFICILSCFYISLFLHRKLRIISFAL